MEFSLDISGVDDWRPATIAEVQLIVNEDLKKCDVEQIAAFEKYAVEPYIAPIIRYGKEESAVVVARKGNEVIYWEDVEEGFNFSPVDSNGQILEHWCNQDKLPLAVNAWIEGRGLHGRCSPAKPLD